MLVTLRYAFTTILVITSMSALADSSIMSPQNCKPFAVVGTSKLNDFLNCPENTLKISKKNTYTTLTFISPLGNKLIPIANKNQAYSNALELVFNKYEVLTDINLIQN